MSHDQREEVYALEKDGLRMSRGGRADKISLPLPPRVGQVPASVEALNDAIDRLDRKLHQLCEKLQPVRLARPQAASGPDCNGPCLSPLAEAISHAVEHIDTLAAYVTDVAEEVEL